MKEIYSIPGKINVIPRKYYITNYARIFSIYGNKIIEMAQNVDKDGYKIVSLTRGDKNESKIYKVHRLVMIYFKGIDPDKPEVNHKDGHKQHNVLANLEWSTTDDNIKHAVKTGLRHRQLKPEVVRGIINDLNSGKYTMPQIAERWNTNVGQVGHIKNNRYKDIEQHRSFTFRTLLTNDEILEIYNNAANGALDEDQAKEHNVSSETISLIRLIKLQKYKEVLGDRPPIYRNNKKRES